MAVDEDKDGRIDADLVLEVSVLSLWALYDSKHSKQ